MGKGCGHVRFSGSITWVGVRFVLCDLRGAVGGTIDTVIQVVMREPWLTSFMVVFHWPSAIHSLFVQQLPLSSSWYHANKTLVVGHKAPVRNV